MNIVESIVADKKVEVQRNREMYPVKLLEQSIYFQTQPVSFCEYIKREDKSGIIAEFKRKSPSKGEINPYAKVEEIVIGYMQAGASALSVLTDTKYFGGRNEDLTIARKLNYCPILRKDFILTEYQVLEAKAIGADVILLIASILTKEEVRDLAYLAHSLDMEVLLEIHNEDEFGKINELIDAVGINNRDLKTFSVDLEHSIHLADQLPDNMLKIAESGINNIEDIQVLSEHGFDGFLIGELFMKSDNPVQKCRDLARILINNKKQCYAY